MISTLRIASTRIPCISHMVIGHNADNQTYNNSIAIYKTIEMNI